MKFNSLNNSILKNKIKIKYINNHSYKPMKLVTHGTNKI